jgi:c(7)-type cytochrome triheme protein
MTKLILLRGKLAFILLVLCVSTMVGAEYADVVLNRMAEKNDIRPVIFPHWFHRIRFRCKVCHHELGFEMRAGANEITMGKIIDGQYCGMCHNGEIAWSVDNCHLCHSGKPGLKTGIRGSNQTGGPGRW